MRFLENRIPPVIVALIFALVIWWVSIISPAAVIGDTLRLIITAFIFAIGLFFCIAGVVSFRQARTTANPLKPEAASSLVSSGIYRISRNPMYVGFALFLLSFTVYLSSPLSIVGAIAYVLYMNEFQIKPEERALEKNFSVAFSAYMQKVRRWL